MADFRLTGPQANVWLERLPGLVAQYCQRWSLSLSPEKARYGAFSLVVPVTRGSRPLMLKLAYPPTSSVHDEMVALRAWAGGPAAMVVDASLTDHVLLLERLDAAHPLEHVPLFDAGAIAGALIRTLGVPAPPQLPTSALTAARIASSASSRNAALGYPVAPRVITTVCSLASQLSELPSPQLLVHGDLHYGNILTGIRYPWIAIDPSPVSGHLEQNVAELLWSRARELAHPRDVHTLLNVIVDAGQLDAQLAFTWSVVRCIDYWLWSLEHHLTHDSPRLARLTGALLSKYQLV